MGIRGAEELPRQSGPHAEQAELLEVALLIAHDAPLERVFSAAAERAARRLRAEAGGVLRFIGDERAVIEGVWREGGHRALPVNAELDFDRHNSAAGRARTTRRPARADSYQEGRGELPVAMRAVGLRSSVAAPLVVDGEVWGVLVVSTERAEPLEAGGEQRILDLAELAGRAVAQVEARRRLARSRVRLVAAGDEARRRLERGLHEGLQQHLLALTLKLRVAQARADAGPEVVAALLDDAVAEAMTAIEELREFARELYPIVLSERGLAAAVQAVATRSAVPVHLRELPRRRYAALTEATAYFVVVDALAAAARAAPAEPAEVAVAERGGLLVVDVRHASIGGARDAFAALCERVAAVGGRLEDDGAALLRAEIPVEH